MRVNVYAEEMTDRVEIISKVIGEATFTGLRLYLELPASYHRDPESGALIPATASDQQPAQQLQMPFLHHIGDDDSSAVTFWGKRDLRDVLRKMLAKLDMYYGHTSPPSGLDLLKRVNITNPFSYMVTTANLNFRDKLPAWLRKAFDNGMAKIRYDDNGPIDIVVTSPPGHHVVAKDGDIISLTDEGDLVVTTQAAPETADQA